MNYIEEYFNLVGVDEKYISDFIYLGKPYSIIPDYYNLESFKGYTSGDVFKTLDEIKSFVKMADLFIFYCYFRDKNPLMKLLLDMNLETEVLHNIYDALFYRAVVRYNGGMEDWVESFTKRADFKSVVSMSIYVLEHFDLSLTITYESLLEILELL